MRLKWDGERHCWLAPPARLDGIVQLLLNDYEAVHLWRQAWPAPDRTCGPLCWWARGLFCICSCGGRAHGRGEAGREISQAAPAQRWVRTVLRRDEVA